MTEMPTAEERQAPTCDMIRDCKKPVAYLDVKGYVYCETHGPQRKRGGVQCRKLKPAEIEALKAGKKVPYTPPPAKPKPKKAKAAKA